MMLPLLLLVLGATVTADYADDQVVPLADIVRNLSSSNKPASPAPWCNDGISTLDLQPDSNVSVYFVQSPLFGDTFGDLLGRLNLYHTAIVLAQGEGAARRNWTLEFDATTNILGAVLPAIDGPAPHRLTFNADARFCLTKGVLHGSGHWKKHFDLLASLTPAQANLAINTFVPSVNSSMRSDRPIYQLWRVVERGFFRSTGKLLKQDLTCADGVNWFLHYIVSKLGVPMPASFSLYATKVVINALSIKRANVSDPVQWKGIVEQYQHMQGLVGGGSHPHHGFARLMDAFSSFPCRWLWDGNSKSYYEIVGNRFPFLSFTYVPSELSGPEWLDETPTTSILI